MRRAVGTLGDEAAVAPQLTGNAVNLRCLETLGKGEGRQNARQTLGHHGFSTARRTDHNNDLNNMVIFNYIIHKYTIINNMLGIIYKYTNKLNHKVYIGQTLHEEERKSAHFTSSANNKFHKAIHYYGWINFDYEVIETVEQSKLSDRELYWINYYDSVNNGYNTKSSSCVDAIEQKIILKQNGYNCSHLPFGYEHRNKDGKVYINEENANIIRNIFNDYISGCSYKDIKIKYNKVANTVLKNEKYKGNDVFPQIISEETYNTVQSLIESSKNKPRRCNKIIIDGVEYSSINSASKSTGIDRRRIKKIM